jgi:hypothetical protein
MDTKIFSVLILVVMAMMCSCQEAQPPEKLLVIIDNSHQPRRYPYGFTCFLGTVDTSGLARVPTRYAMAPRKGFMDNLRVERRVQNPVFWGTDAMRLSFDGVAVPKNIVVGHKSRDEKEWTVVFLDVLEIKRDAEGNYRLNMATIEKAKASLPADSERIYAALEIAKAEFERLSDAEP